MLQEGSLMLLQNNTLKTKYLKTTKTKSRTKT